MPGLPAALQDVLREGLHNMGLALNATQTGQLLAYMDLIQKWNRVYNLTAVRDPAEMLTHHLLDSLAVVQPLQQQMLEMRPPETVLSQQAGDPGAVHAGVAEVDAVQAGFPGSGMRLLDVGSGAGLPGVVIAICFPGMAVHCVDTVGKKAAFVQQVAATLRLPNLRGIHARVETLTDKYQVITSRAFATLSDFARLSAQALAEQGVWLGMKGKHPAEEIQALPASVQVFHVKPLAVPGLDARRCIVWMRPTPG